MVVDGSWTVTDCDPGYSSKYSAYWSDHPLVNIVYVSKLVIWEKKSGYSFQSKRMSTSLTSMKVIFQTVTLCDKQFPVAYIEFLFFTKVVCVNRRAIWQEGTPVNTSYSMCYWSSSNPCHIVEISYGCICHILQLNQSWLYYSSS